jgi:hypothetical protein
MAFEIPVDSDYFDHPKTVQLKAMVGSEADIFPLRLWRWASRFAKNGVISSENLKISDYVEQICDYRGKKGALHSALVKVGFLEADGRTIHDWKHWIGRSIFLYEEKKRKQRLRNSSGIVPEDHQNYSGTIPNISGTIPPRNSEIRNSEMRCTEKDDNSSLSLAQLATFLSGKGQKESSVNEWNAAISDLIRANIPAEEIRNDLEETKGMNGSKKSEPWWTFKERLEAKFGKGNGKHKNGMMSQDEFSAGVMRIIEEQENAAKKK